MKILAVDDEPIFLDILMLALEQLGYDDITLVHSAEKAKETIQAAQQPFDCLLLDIRMPGIGGIELTAWIRGRPEYRQTPILMVTQIAERHYVEGAFAAGATDYICKPIDSMDLKARLSTAARSVELNRRSAELKAKIGEYERQGEQLDFTQPFDLPEAEQILRLPIFKGFIGSLSQVGSRVTLLGIKVTNGELLHARLPKSAFIEAMTDVALATHDALKSVEHQMTYAGAGAFCCRLSDCGPSHLKEVALRINFGLEQFDQFYPPDLLPTVRIGQPVVSKHRFLDRGTDLIGRAIAEVSTRQEAGAAKSWFAA